MNPDVRGESLIASESFPLVESGVLMISDGNWVMQQSIGKNQECFGGNSKPKFKRDMAPFSSPKVRAGPSGRKYTGSNCTRMDFEMH